MFVLYDTKLECGLYMMTMMYTGASYTVTMIPVNFTFAKFESYASYIRQLYLICVFICLNDISYAQGTVSRIQVRLVI